MNREPLWVCIFLWVVFVIFLPAMLIEFLWKGRHPQQARSRKHPRSFDEMREDASKRFSNIIANLAKDRP